ncbi:MAG: peptidylprolyl isomerase [Gammaproteobacteria bacterium]|jgi:peptidyl-prolyl cis-trans isomerase SurA|nr:peptidylprolyl isomerase [Gammaproteobacteria bacterium]MDP6616195.1 peptidylprolyl isomerase [Gammaproteobacteria bacterium]MDP6695597.1 peptidylprolyl isomerase [Gammaproteobacteria bacterium]
MHKRTHIALALFVVVMTLQPGTARAQTRELSDTGVLIDGIAAVVNDGAVLLSELDEQTMLIVRRLRAENTQLPPQEILVGQVLERLIIMEIQLQRARRDGITMPDEVLNRALADVARRNSTTLAELPSLLARDGVDYTSYRKEMREQLIVERLRQRDVVSRIGVTPRELGDHLERERNSAYRNMRYRVSHILISLSTTTTPEELEAASQKAWDLYDQLIEGADFAQAAVAYSDAQTALEGGSMGWRNGDALPTLFAEVVPNMEAGQISEPVRTSSGFHIVKLDEVQGGEPIMENQARARHILMETDQIMDDDVVWQKLTEIRQSILDGDDFATIAKAVSDDPSSAIEGGDLGWNGSGVFVDVFEETMNKLELNEISEPFKTQFGWHILQVLERRVHDTTDDVARNRAMIAIRDSKVAEETELWLRQMRDESFVEYRL